MRTRLRRICCTLVIANVELNRWRGGWSAQIATAFLFARDLRLRALRTSLRAGECSPALKEKPHD